jgi:hypothetical protein
LEVGEKLGEVEMRSCCGGSLERKEETEGGGAWWGTAIFLTIFKPGF